MSIPGLLLTFEGLRVSTQREAACLCVWTIIVMDPTMPTAWPASQLLLNVYPSPFPGRSACGSLQTRAPAQIWWGGRQKLVWNPLNLGWELTWTWCCADMTKDARSHCEKPEMKPTHRKRRIYSQTLLTSIELWTKSLELAPSMTFS